VLQARDVVERWTCDCASLRLVASTLANRNRDTVTGRHKHPSPIEVTGADARQFSVQTFMVFMPVSASVLVLNVPLSTIVVVVVVGFLSTIVHFLVVASRTT